MADVVLVGGRLEIAELHLLDRLSGRLATRTVASRLVCIAGNGGGPGVIECPGLGNRWRRPWALRRLTGGDEIESPELLHVLGLEMAEIGLELAERWERPYVLALDEFPGRGDRLRVSRRWCRGLIVPCADLADELVESYGVPRGWIDVVAPGIVTAEPVPSEGRSPRITVVGTAVAVDRIEGLATFFQAARRILDTGRDVEFVVARTRGEESGLRRLAEWLQLKDRVTFADGHLEGEACWRVLDVYCQSSLVPHAGRGLGLALAHAIPAVASDVPGLRSWIIPEQTGRLVPPGDPDALANAILDLLAAPDQAHALGRNGRAFVADTCNPDREADLLATIYRRALAGPLPEWDSEAGVAVALTATG